MESLTQTLSDIFGDAFEALGLDRAYGEVVPSGRPDLGQFQCNGALPAASQSEPRQNPRALAEQVVAALPQRELFSQVNIAGPGFINISISDNFLADHIQQMAQDERLGVPKVEEPSRIVLDFGGPNAARRMAVHHLRASIIGDSLQRLLRFVGEEVISDVHIGDWGLQMGS